MSLIKSLLFLIMAALPISTVFASPDLDDITMDVVSDNDPAEVAHEIELPDDADIEGRDERDDDHSDRKETGKESEHEKETEKENEVEREVEVEKENEIEKEIEIEQEVEIEDKESEDKEIEDKEVEDKEVEDKEVEDKEAEDKDDK